MITSHVMTGLIALVLAVPSTHGSNPESAIDHPGTVRARITTTMILKVDGEEPRRLPVVGVVGENGVRFKGDRRVDDLQLVLAWDWLADLDPRGGGARIAGVLGLLNDTDRDRRFEVRVDFPLDPLIAESARIGGTVRAILVMDDEGGRVDLPAGESLFTALIDGTPVRRLHPGPIAMGGARAGTAVADASFGAPYPSLESPAVHDAVGMSNCFNLSGGDQLQFGCELMVAGDPADFIRRRSTDPVRIEDRDRRIVIDLDGRPRTKSRRGGVSRNFRDHAGERGPGIVLD